MSITPRALLVACIATTAMTATAQNADTFGAFVDADGVVRADSRCYRAEFGVDAVVLEVPALTGDGVQPRLELRYLGSRRGAARGPTVTAVQPTLAGDFVHYSRGHVVESYEVGANGYEQSFRIDQRPAGSGDLVLSIGVGGNVTAKAMGQAHRGIVFRHRGRDAIRYGEAHVFERGGEHIAVRTAYDGRGLIELIVPASFLDSATYPIVVDPAVGPVLNPGGPLYNDSRPDVAYDQHYSLGYIFVWQRAFSPTLIVIRGQFYDRDGNPNGGAFAITTTGVAENPVVIPTAIGRFLVVWEQDDEIRGQRYSVYTGLASASPFTISSPGPGERDRRPSVGSSAHLSGFLVAWDRTTAGNTQPSEIIVRHYVVYVNPPFGPEQVLESVSPAAGHVRSVRLAKWNAYEFVSGSNSAWYLNRAVWDRFYTTPTPGDYDVRTCAFRSRWDSANGTYAFGIDDPTGSVAVGIGVQELRPDIAARADDISSGNHQYCVAWQDDGDVHARMYDQGGSLGGEFPVRATSNFEGLPAVGAGHCEFTVAYGEIIPPAAFAVDIRAARVLLDGTVAVTDRAVDVLGGPFQDGIRVSSKPFAYGPPGNTAMITWFGQTGAGTGLNDVRARLFEPVEPNHSLFGSACPGPLGELPAIGTIGNQAVAGENVEVSVTNAPAVSLAVLFVSDQLVSVPIPGAPGCNLYAGLPFLGVLLTVTDAAGARSVQVQIPCSVPSGIQLAFQWGVYTPGHNAFGWIVSNDMDVYWSHF